MRFFEYESREVVKRAGIPTTEFGFATTPEEARAVAERIAGPVVIKSQVLTGGRMKAGGVQFADTPDAAEPRPSGRRDDGAVVALDAHMDTENEARPRPEAILEALGVGEEETRQAREATPFEIAGEQVDAQDHRGVAGNVTEFDGNLGLVIGAGGGSLTLFDAVRAHGGKPANSCEIGSNPRVAHAG